MHGKVLNSLAETVGVSGLCFLGDQHEIQLLSTQ